MTYLIIFFNTIYNKNNLLLTNKPNNDYKHLKLNQI